MTESLTKYSANNSVTPTWNADQIALIKSQIAVNCTDAELALFGQVCQRTGLDPFSRQIYAIKRGSKMTVQVSIDGFRTIAARSGLYGGSVTEWCGDDGVWRDVWLGSGAPYAAKTTVWRIGSSQPFVGVAKFAHYNQNQGLWSKMSDTMIAKCSESLALRKAFPSELSGLYTTDEMPEDKPLPERVDEFANFKTAAIDCFKSLGWDKEKRVEWAREFNNKPSTEWTKDDWEAALAALWEEIDAHSDPEEKQVHF
jgi:phage recombination protein Bet